jgi:cell division protein FtsB
LRYLLIPALVAAALLVAWLDSDSGIRTYLRLRDDVRASEVRLDALRAEIGALQAEAEALEESDLALERAIREELEWARPGETVVRLPPAPATPSPSDSETP